MTLPWLKERKREPEVERQPAGSACTSISSEGDSIMSIATKPVPYVDTATQTENQDATHEVHSSSYQMRTPPSTKYRPTFSIPQTWRNTDSTSNSRKRRTYAGLASERQMPAQAISAADWERLRNAYFDAAFALPHECLVDWPGFGLFFSYLQDQISVAREQILDPFLSLTNPSHASTLVDAIELIISIAEIFNESNILDASVSEILDLLLAKRGIDRLNHDVRIFGRRVVFACLCWLTSLVKPSAVASPKSLSIVVPARKVDLRGEQSIENCNRPIAGLLRSFGSVLPPLDSRNEQGPVAELLHASTLNYYSLHTVGKIRIQWIDTLSAHLDFHPLTRTLLIYRFPTMCALSCLGKSERHCSNRILRGYYSPTVADCTLELMAFRQEVLLSYRLIFGQHRQSRNLYNNVEQKAVAKDGFYDNLLDTLCGTSNSKFMKQLPSAIWAESCRDSEGFLQEQDAYSTDTDFPLLGQRLLKLQSFNLRQSPSRIRDLWRDRRNPLQWYTFWAVLLIGGFSLVLTLVQVLLSAAQLAASFSG